MRRLLHWYAAIIIFLVMRVGCSLLFWHYDRQHEMNERLNAKAEDRA